MTGMGWIMVLTLIIGGALLLMKIAPIYMRHSSVMQALEFTAEKTDPEAANLRKVRQLMEQQLNINSVYEFDIDTLTLEKTREGTKLLLDYEVREALVGNLSVVVSFSEVAEVP
jgi:hypothetical protein